MTTIEAHIYTAKSGQIVVIRSARPNDALAIHTITEQALMEGSYHITEPQEFTVTVTDTEAWIQQHAERPADVLLVAEVDGAVVGLIHFEAEGRKRLAHYGELAMNVASTWREQGVGHCLLAALLGWATDHPQVEKVGLRALATNERALHLYTSVGFVEDGRRLKAIKLGPGQYIDEILMSRFVTSVEG
jgi:RimJ/RimL family protein N-acetyltransferase